MYKKKKTYELEVHLGLLVIVVILMGLNLISNYVIYNARNIINEELTGELYKSSLSIGRYLQNNNQTILSENDIKKILVKDKVDDIKLFKSPINQKTNIISLQKLQDILSQMPDSKNDIISKIIIKSDYYTLIRGDKEEYYYASPVTIGKNNYILLLSKDLHKLAYIDDAAGTLTLITIIALIAVMLIYILLYRFILSPFKQLKDNATSAGRSIRKQNYEVASVVEEYEVIINELKEKEIELVKLHNQATKRADSYEQFNEYLLSSMQAGIITIDKSGLILTINRSAEKICNISSEMICGSNYTEISFLSDRIKCKIESTLLDNIHHSYEEYDVKEQSLQLGITISPVCDSETDPIGASILINDISEINKLRNEIEKNRQMSALGEMSAGLAHQLRNSLGAIVGYNQLVKKRLHQNDLETTITEAMAAELHESEKLISRFLNFTKPFDFSPESENAENFITEIIETLQVRNDFSHINFTITNNIENQYQVFIDALLLKQAIVNIIENSKNAYSDNTGNMQISISKTKDEHCKIKIQDFACGIDEEDLKNIFTPFYSTNPSGTGLGLPLAQKIIALHEGKLDVDSIVGEGTTFSIQIPFINIDAKNISENNLVKFQ